MGRPRLSRITAYPAWSRQLYHVSMEWTVSLEPLQMFSFGDAPTLNPNYSYRTLADRLLHMQLVPSRGQVKRDVSYEFMNRQMVWHAFTVSDELIRV